MSTPDAPDTPGSARPPGPRLAVDGKLWRTDQSPVTIGRSASNAVVVDDPRVSKRHAVLIWDGRRWVLRDRGSSNGTFVDGRQITAAELAGPCTINLGGADGHPLRISLAATTEPATPAGSAATPATPAAPAVPPVTAQGPTPDPPTQPSVPHVAGPRPIPKQPPAPRRTPPATTPAAALPPPVPVGGALRIGRAADNELVVPDLLVSRHHAELRRTERGWTLLDLGSANGSYVDGVRVRTAVELAPGQRVTFGTKSYVAVPAGLAPAEAAVVGTELPALAARDLTVQVESGATILDHVSFTLEPGQLLAIVGPTGSGKSTLLKALTGSRRPEGGSVEVRGVPLYDAYDELCRTIGYVPQDDILHLPLTIRQALEFGAELRFPADTTDEDRSRRVDEVLAELSLTHRSEVPIEKVSGGQRKRTSVALELLTRPELLFLDEPTSGLDPGFERTVMELLRELADAGRAVVVVTHSLQSLELCDRVLFLAPGGAIAFFGEPADALGFFGRRDFIDVFRDLEASNPEFWSSRRQDAKDKVGIAATADTGAVLAAPRAAPPAQPWKAQVGILARRQRAILQADQQNRWFLAGSVLVPAVLILLLVPAQALSLGQDEATNPRLLLSAIVVATVAIGTANAIREIVKEVPIYLRERAVGLQRSAYLASKLLVVGTLTVAQAAALTIITTLRAGGPDRANVLLVPHLELMVDVALTGLSAVALGLALSTLVSSSEKAMALVPVVFVVQWLFCGSAFDLESRPVMREAARITSANWGMAAAASSVGENELSKTCSEPPEYTDGGVVYDEYGNPYVDPEAEAKRKAEESRRKLAGTCDKRWESHAGTWLVDVAALVALTVAAMALADRLLARKEPLAAQRASDWPSPWEHGPRREF